MSINRSGLVIGQMAPSFSLESSLGTKISLADYREKKNLLLLFMRYLG